MEEASDRLLTFTRFPKSQWKSIRSSNAIERLREEFKRRIKAQTVLPSAETAAMLVWALLASGQITMRKVDGWRSLGSLTSPHELETAKIIFSTNCDNIYIFYIFKSPCCNRKVI